VRQGQHGSSSMPGQLPSTIAVTDQAYTAPPQQLHPHPQGGHYHSQPHPHSGHPQNSYEPPRAQLPDTVNVMSIMDQPPPHQPSYGVGGGGAHGYGSQPMQQPLPQPAAPSAPPQRWETLYTPEGRPYYYNPATRETSWDPPR
jgi:WW domain